jgi:hypothetical protein
MKTLMVAALVVVLGVTAAAPEARADESSQGDWWGWQTLIVDGVSLSIGIVGSVNNKSGISAIGGLGMLLGAPIVDFVHGKTSKGLISLGMRLGADVMDFVGLVMVLSDAFCDANCSTSNSNGTLGAGLIIGGLALYVGAVVYDAVVDARYAPRVQPVVTVSPQTGATFFGLAGRF